MRSAPELAALLDNGTREDCLAFFAGMSERARRKHAATIQKTYRALDREWVTRGRVTKRRPGWGRRWEVARAGLFATATPEELRRWSLPVAGDAWDLVADRGRKWANAWALFEVTQDPRNVRFVRPAVDAGFCDPPDHENYALGHIDWLLTHRDHRETPPVKVLERAPEFLEKHLWTLFESDGTSDCNLAGHDKYAGQRTFSAALVALAAKGVVSRERLLDASLDALARDFPQFRAGWFSRFHEALAPTPDERVARLDRYLLLTGSSIPPTVSFATKALESLARKGALPAAELAAALEPVLYSRAKATVLRGLGLLARVVGSEDAVVACAASVALLHDAAEVQKRALTLLESLYPDPAVAPEGVRAAVARNAELVKASVRKRVKPWLGPGGRAPAVSAAAEPTVSRLLPEKVEPIANLEELIEVLAAVLEDPTDAIGWERALDGIARFGAAAPDLAALAKRAKRLSDREIDDLDDDSLQPCLGGLILAWHAGQTFEQASACNAAIYPSTTGRIAVARMVEIGERLGSRHVLLSTPTDTRGFIRPAELVRRARANPSPGLADQILALLRLGPKGRTARVQERAGDVPGEFGRALRYALGNDRIRIGETAALWIAAARARDPRGDDPRVDKKHPKLGPGGAVAAHCRFRSFEKRGRRFLELEPTPAPPKKVPDLHPTVLLHQRSFGRPHDAIAAGSHASLVRWTAIMAPGCTEDYFAHACRRLDIEGAAVQWEFPHYFSPLFFADVDLGPNALRLLALGLAAREPGVWGMAVDCALAAMGDGRLTADALGGVLAECLPTGVVLAGRWARALGEVARTSPHAAALVRTASAAALRGDPAAAPKDLSKILELLLELSIEADVGIEDPDARRFLERVETGGKTKKLKRALLGL